MSVWFAGLQISHVLKGGIILEFFVAFDGVSLDSSVEVEKSKEPVSQAEGISAFWTEERVKALRDDIVMESQIACLDVHDVIHEYCSATTDRVLDVEVLLTCYLLSYPILLLLNRFVSQDKIDLLRNEVRENRQILQLILQKLSALERNVLY